MNIIDITLSKSYTDATAIQFGAVKGAPCTIQSTSLDADGNSIVTFRWKNDSNEVKTSTLLVKKGVDGTNGTDGIGVTNIVINSNNHLICTLTDGSTIDAGEFKSNGELQEDLTATVTIGTVTSGKKYVKGTSIETILRDILIKEEAPSITLTLNPNTSLYDVVNDTLSTIVLTATVTKKTYAPTKVTYYVDDTVVNERSITNGGTFSYTYNFNTPTNTNHTFKAVVTDGKLSSNATKSIKFVGNTYYGIVSSDIGAPTSAQVKGLNKTLKDVKGYTWSGITTDFGKVVYAYPKSFGELSSIKDPINNFTYTESFSKATVVVDGIDYYVYTQSVASASDNVKLVFA